MLVGGTDLLYRSVLAAGHRHYVRVEVWSGNGVLLEEDLVFGTGSVSATLNSRVSRNLSLDVAFELYPDDPGDLLAPFGNELRVYRGVELGDGSTNYVWQVFRGKITSVTQSSGGCSLTAADRAAEVIDVAFASPQNSQTANTVSQEFVRLVSDAVSNASFGASDNFAKRVEQLTWEFDRGSALDELATSVGALWFPLANGDFVLRRYPWSVTGVSVLTFTDATGGTVLDWSVSRSRTSIFNVVTVTGERLNGDAPVYATATDDTVGSPTSVNGGFGVRSRVERLQTPSTQGGAQSAANALLRTYVAPTEQWVLQVVPDASLELGDVTRVQVGGRDEVQVVTDFTMPLDLSANMTVLTRSLVVGDV